ncbi:MAG: DUF2259 domain-containing protein [Treponema sp.]|nr:DUF2259 domain-containing protein [Treponema sp.]MCL2252128.1 DUF2259 domain-containing protein [Treponema sp.]
MFLKKLFLIFLLVLLTSVSALWAGDNAVFVDLGFSPDGRTYMFGQHGVLSPSLRPWAEIYIVDVTRNAFVPNGKVSLTHETAINAGQDGSGIFQRLVSGNSSLASRFNINYQNQGLPLYISRDENPPANGERIDFRDFLAGKAYKVQLVSTITGSGRNVRSQFFLNVESASSNGQVKNYTVGTPNFIRQGVSQYNIKRVIIDSSGSSIIFVIEMKKSAENGFDIRYMVEALRL